tara:strand:- start:1809 stop:2024 length:216 start_codon:yes stop_codon:yes gene_type:complete
MNIINFKRNSTKEERKKSIDKLEVVEQSLVFALDQWRAMGNTINEAIILEALEELNNVKKLDEAIDPKHLN